MIFNQSRFSMVPLGPLNFSLAKALLEERWGGDFIVSLGKINLLKELEGYLAWVEDEIVGLVTFTQTENSLQIVSMDSFRDGIGVGKALNDAAVQTAKQRKCTRIWLVITNDNLEGLQFYQKRGWNMKALHLNSMIEARIIKPAIPLTAENGIRILHEIEIEINLAIQDKS